MHVPTHLQRSQRGRQAGEGLWRVPQRVVDGGEGGGEAGQPQRDGFVDHGGLFRRQLGRTEVRRRRQRRWTVVGRPPVRAQAITGGSPRAGDHVFGHVGEGVPACQRRARRGDASQHPVRGGQGRVDIFQLVAEGGQLHVGVDDLLGVGGPLCVGEECGSVTPHVKSTHLSDCCAGVYGRGSLLHIVHDLPRQQQVAFGSLPLVAGLYTEGASATTSTARTTASTHLGEQTVLEQQELLQGGLEVAHVVQGVGVRVDFRRRRRGIVGGSAASPPRRGTGRRGGGAAPTAASTAGDRRRCRLCAGASRCWGGGGTHRRRWTLRVRGRVRGPRGCFVTLPCLEAVGQ